MKQKKKHFMGKPAKWRDGSFTCLGFFQLRLTSMQINKSVCPYIASSLGSSVYNAFAWRTETRQQATYVVYMVLFS